jgi:TfoX/Sxy family transcriptional regulator of competence genes
LEAVKILEYCGVNNMASDLNFVTYIVDQIKNAGIIEYRNMFGEYVLYSNKKFVALICDNKLFVKPTEAGRLYIGSVVESSPYPGAKPSFLIEEKIEDTDWLCQLIILTEKELPLPKKRKPKK